MHEPWKNSSNGIDLQSNLT